MCEKNRPSDRSSAPPRLRAAARGGDRIGSGTLDFILPSAARRRRSPKKGEG
jgi:hypothetical protein